MRVLDLFSGIGGFSLGLERAGGFKTVAFCEISPKCRHLLNHHWPDVPCHEDVCSLRGETLGDIDVICGGFPCQDISSAGLRAGIAGARSGLWAEYARLIGELRPRFVIVENVADLLVRGIHVVLADLAALGYDAWWDRIRAADVGAPHLRTRIWIVAYPGSEQHQGFGLTLQRALAAELSRPHSDPDDGGRESGESLRARRAEPRGHSQVLRSHGWASEPDVGRVAHGISARVDRLHGLGNAVVPQIPELIGRAIRSALGLPPATAASAAAEPD